MRLVPLSLLSVLTSPHSDKAGDRICIFGRSYHQPPTTSTSPSLQAFLGVHTPHDGQSVRSYYINNSLHTVIISLAGMIHKIGLLPACNNQQVPFAYKMYTRPDELGWKQSNAFKRAFSIDVDIEFVGVWYVLSPFLYTPISLCSLQGHRQLRRSNPAPPPIHNFKHHRPHIPTRRLPRRAPGKVQSQPLEPAQ